MRRSPAWAVALLAAELPAVWCSGEGGVVLYNFLTTPTFSLATFMFFFLVCTIAFQKSTSWASHKLHKMHREGLAHALEHLVEELTAIGFISLVLIALSGSFEKICVSYPSGITEHWTYLDSVKGCDCCLSHTKDVAPCLAYERQCGRQFCNCNGQNPACLEDYMPAGDILGRLDRYVSKYNCSCADGGSLTDAIEYVDVDLEDMEYTCENVLASGHCPEGQVPFVTAHTLEQIHLFIFTVAVMHVIMAGLMILLASLHIQIWRSWPEDELHREAMDRNEASIHDAIEAAKASQTAQANIRARPIGRLRPNGLLRTLRHTFRMAPAPAGAPAGRASVAPPPASGKAGAAEPEDGSEHAPPASRQGTVFFDAPSQNPLTPGSDVENGAERTSLASQSFLYEMQQNVLKADGVDSVLVRADRDVPHDWLGRLVDFAISWVASFKVPPVSRTQFNIMRASFLTTHQVPSTFDFMGFIARSLEDDCSHVVAMGYLEWLTITTMVLITGAIGWPAMIYLIIGAVLQTATNTKLTQIIRHVCRGGVVNRLDSYVFWFNKPSLLLYPIRYNLFLTSFMFSTPLFFWWQFGAQSCPFTSQDQAFWFAWVVPWWCSLIFAGVMFLNLSLRTLPMYSLAVQMGSNFKRQMLPKGVRDKLLFIARDVRRQHRAGLVAAHGRAPSQH